MKCDGQRHNLEIIFVHRQNELGEAVVRWCSDCGCIVVDEDFDGRTSPGGYVKMRFPRMTYPNQRCTENG